MDKDDFKTLSRSVPYMPGVSDSYSFIPTSTALAVMENKGWVVDRVEEARTREPIKRGFQKHMVRLIHPNLQTLKAVGDVRPEIILINSHDGSSSFQVGLGLFRLACTNGLVVSQGQFEMERIKHVGFTAYRVLLAVERVEASFPRVNTQIELFTRRQMSLREIEDYAKRAVGLRWEDGREDLDLARLMAPQRETDMPKNLWSVFNIAQERLIQGDHRMGIRRMTAIDNSVKLNQDLWALTESFA